MARVTIEDCLPHVGNPFDLAMLAARDSPIEDEGGDEADDGRAA
jgi:hypothetical protein